MKTYFDCIPCYIRQALDAVRSVTDDQEIQGQVLQEVLDLVAKMDMNATPPAVAQKIHRIIKRLTKTADPYKQEKQHFNQFAMSLLPKYKKLIDSSENPLEIALRLAIAGNIIDLGVQCSLELSEAEKVIETTLTDDSLDLVALDDFQQAVAGAKDILYLADNTGEIVFDKLLIEQIGPEKITLVVRGVPIINDATLEDAKAVGLADLVKTMDNGDDAPGTILETCSEAFRNRFKQADLVIAKGQGNYETLSDVDKNMFFVLKAKCPVIAEHLGCQVGTLVLRARHKNF
ncbi:MAG: ARMT1-like domain-containing protein [Phycisphaerae bacterium]|nr:ARMT1-like domain-containing protein [Phycisphaerae bacterium]